MKQNIDFNFVQRARAFYFFGSVVKRLRHRPFTAVTGVQIPLESLRKLNKMAIWCGFTLTFGV